MAPLHIAVRSNGTLSIIEALIAAKADVNAKDKGGNTPLDHARGNNNEPVVDMLNDAGAR